jgi:HPt (histidine-containing phosphotransfer) domain-containing protein
VSQIRRAYRNSDTTELERAAHNLKGSVANFGAAPAVQASLRLERMARDGNLKAAGDAIDTLEQQLERLRVELTKLAS